MGGAPQNAVNSKMFGAAGDGVTDDTVAVTECIASGEPIFELPGTYLVANVPFISGTAITGHGDDTIYKPLTSGDRAFVTDSGSSDIADNVTGVRLKSVKVLGDAANSGFSEFRHLMSLSGVTDVEIDDVTFEGFRGDGIILASSLVNSTTERHNKDVRITNCRFDGVNNENRNAVAVIDCDGLVIEDNDFTNCSKSTMPGAVDFEPNSNAFAVIKNVEVRRNRFTDCGGNVGTIAVAVPSACPLPGDMWIEDNVFENVDVPISFNVNRVVAAGEGDMNINIRGNVGADGARPIRVYSGRGFYIEDNTWRDFTNIALLGFNGTNDKPGEIYHARNTYQRCGSVNGTGLMIFGVDHLTLELDWFDDCGTGSPGSSNAIDFNTGTSSYVSIIGLTVTSPTSKTLVAIQKEAAHTFTPATNVFRDCVLNGLGNNFQT